MRPPPQAWLANCLHPTRVVTVSSVNKAVGVEEDPEVAVGGGGDGKTAGGAGGAGSKAGGGGDRGTKRGRGEGSGAKFEVTEQDGFIWVQCDACSKWCVWRPVSQKYHPEICVSNALSVEWCGGNVKNVKKKKNAHLDLTTYARRIY